MENDSRFKRVRGTFEQKNAVYKDRTDGTLSDRLSTQAELDAWKSSREAASQSNQPPSPPVLAPATSIHIRIDSSTQYPVSGRDLHAALGAATEYPLWMRRRLEAAGACEGDDYTEVVGEGTNLLDFMLTMELAKHIAMMDKSERGRQVRQYFIGCEQALTESRFNDPLEAAKLYIESETARRAAETKLLETTREVVTLGDQVEALTAKVEAPNTCVTLTQFAKDTESVLGMTPPILFQYLRDTDVISRVPASKWDKHNVVLAPWNGCGYFQYVRHSIERPARNEAGEVESMASVTKTTPMLTRDKTRDGLRVRMGGYSWLLAKISKDPRAALYRLVARDGGREGRWAPLYGARMFPAPTYDGLICESDPAIITFWKNPAKDAGQYKFVVCRYTDAPGQKGFLKANGVTIDDALEALLSETPAGARKPLAKENLFDE